MNIRHTVLQTAEIDRVIIVATDEHITGLYFPGHWTRPDWSSFGREVAADAVSSDSLLTEATRQLTEYLRGDRTEFDFPIALSGTPFQERVWAILRDIPFGQTLTYGEIAERLGDRSLARMVGQAVGHNPLSIVVGCHRVVGSTGKLTGYAGGLERKQFLLALEAPSPAEIGALF